MELGKVHLTIPEQYGSSQKEKELFNATARSVIGSLFTIPGQNIANWHEPYFSTNKQSDKIVSETIKNIQSERNKFSNLNEENKKLNAKDLDICVIASFAEGNPDAALEFIKNAGLFNTDPARILREYVNSGIFTSVLKSYREYGHDLPMSFLNMITKITNLKDEGGNIIPLFALRKGLPDKKEPNDDLIFTYLEELKTASSDKLKDLPTPPEISAYNLIKVYE